jgi:alcohol dehydrogenase (cytochrome c)
MASWEIVRMNLYSREASGTSRISEKLLGAATMAATFVFIWQVPGQGIARATDGVPSAVNMAQTISGRDIYAGQCASCHGVNLDQGSAPPLRGRAFTMRWLRGDRTLGDFALAIHAMPKGAPGSLSQKAYHDVTTYILSANDLKVNSEARTDDKLKSLQAGADQTASEPGSLTSAMTLPETPATAEIAQTSAPTHAELRDQAPSDWLMYNRTFAGDRFSPLTQINTSNVAKLQAVCILSPGVLGSFQSSPIIYKGVGFISSTYGVYAFNAATCERKWEFTYSPAGPEGIRTNRGMAVYDGKLFRGTTDGHLIALDMQSGKLLWDAHVGDSAYGYGIGAAPVAFQGRVIVGLSGGDLGTVGHIYAFDANTGKRIWTFDTIQAESWPKGAEYGGGATWTTVAVDTERQLVFAPIGNPAPDYFAGARPGDNLYTNSVVAIDANTGKIAWHVQQIAGDFHDWDTAAAPVLYTQDRRSLMAVGTKAGYVYIYDRDTHRLVSRTNVVSRLNDSLPFSDKPLRVCPGTTSGIEWNGPAYDPITGSLFVNTVDWCATYTAKAPQGWKRGNWYGEANVTFDPPENMTGWTYALNAATGGVRWSRKAPKPMIGAVTPTAGHLVFTGGADGDFLALDARDGKELYHFNTGAAIGGGIATYMVGARQYVAVASGGFGLVDFGLHGAPALIIFALPANSE